MNAAEGRILLYDIHAKQIGQIGKFGMKAQREYSNLAGPAVARLFRKLDLIAFRGSPYGIIDFASPLFYSCFRALSASDLLKCAHCALFVKRDW